MEGVQWEHTPIISIDEGEGQQRQTSFEHEQEHIPPPEIHADTGNKPDNQDLDDWQGLEEEADESYHPVLARRVQLELLHQVQGQRARTNPFDDENYYRWSDVMTNPELLPRHACEKQWEEDQYHPPYGHRRADPCFWARAIRYARATG